MRGRRRLRRTARRVRSRRLYRRVRRGGSRI